MKKRWISLLLAVITALSACQTATLAAKGGFSKTRTYTDGQFSDVAATDWYVSGVKSAYEYGIMQGTGEESFGAQNTLSVAEAIAMAARLHKVYHSGTDQFEASDPWFRVYVNYARENGIIWGEFPDYATPATRAEFVVILRSALPVEVLDEINEVDDGAILDVAMDAQGATAIYDLYRAGILTGSDARGTFQPTSNIDRASVATIIARMVEPSLRQKITLQSPRVSVYAQSDYKPKSIPVASLDMYLAQGYSTMPVARSLENYFQQYGLDRFTPEKSGTNWAFADGTLLLSGTLTNNAVFTPVGGTKEDTSRINEIYFKYGFQLPQFTKFSACPSLKHVELPDTIKELGEYEFVNCPLTRIGIPESVTHLAYNTFGNSHVSGEYPNYTYTLENRDLVIYCVPGSAASDFATKYNVQQVAATQVFHPDGRTCMVSSQEKPEYLKKGWFEAPCTFIYNADGRIEAVENDQIETYRSQGWSTSPSSFSVLYSENGETKVVANTETATLEQQGWHKEIADATTTIYAAGHKTLQVLKGEVDAYESAGWSRTETNQKVTLYAPDGSTIAVWDDEVETYKAVGWYEVPVVSMHTADGTIQVVPISDALEMDYRYLVQFDAQRILRDYPSATMRYGSWAVYVNSNGELCVGTRVSYTIITDFDDCVLHNLTTGGIIVDPDTYFKAKQNELEAPLAWARANKLHDLVGSYLAQQVSIIGLHQEYTKARLEADKKLVNEGFSAKNRVDGKYLK